jgi:hypothetical protein
MGESIADRQTSTGPRSHRLWALIAVVIIAAAATVWILRTSRHAAPKNDCSTIEDMGPQWNSMQQAVAQIQNGPGETKDLIAAADRESAMSDTLRAAASTVSAQDLKDQLAKWAQGTALAAAAQRDAANPSPAPDSGDADTVRAAQLTYDATAALRKSCPNLHLS